MKRCWKDRIRWGFGFISSVLFLINFWEEVLWGMAVSRVKGGCGKIGGKWDRGA